LIKFNGKYYDGQTSKIYPVRVQCDKQTVYINGDDLQENVYFPLGDCQLSPALGRTNRSILFPSGAKCETDNFKAIAELEQQKGGNTAYKIIHLLEQKWKLAIGCMAGLIVSVFLFTTYGIPYIAEVVSRKIPVSMMNKLSDDVLMLLDKQLFEPSKTDVLKQKKLITEVKSMQAEINSGRNYTLKFRGGEKIGANAFALPSGTIIITDELINMIEEEKELTGIILHEIGHIENRHGIRSVLQNTGVFFLISAIAGDMVSITSVAGSFPTLLVESGYSRKFEKEADKFSANFFLNKGWSTKPFQNILKRITKDKELGGDMVATHPGAEERIKLLQSLDKTEN